jgi:hypothetical protein
MMKYLEEIVNCETGESVIQEVSPERLAEIESAKIRNEALLNEIKEAEAKRQAVLDKLGLTADEAAALLG